MLAYIVLVVDDERMVREYVKSILLTNGFQTVEAANGKEALAVVQQTEGRLDAIVSDIQMPKLDGISFVREVRERYPRIPCILISGVVQLDSTANLHFLRKPFLPAQLLNVLRRAIAEAPRVMGAK